jgi:hypothetical protein
MFKGVVFNTETTKICFFFPGNMVQRWIFHHKWVIPYPHILSTRHGCCCLPQLFCKLTDYLRALLFRFNR